MLDDLLREASAPAALGAIVPHAGWVYSGSTAALGLGGIAAANPETVVLFGAVHGPDVNAASLYPRGTWHTPLGGLQVDEDLAGRFATCLHVIEAPHAHRYEHSIEVQLPILKRLLPEVRIVPISVRPGPDSAEVGRFCARQAADSGQRVAFVGSTDLTHYGPAFGFEPHGRGREGIRWAKEINDRRLVALIQAMDAEGVVPEAEMNRNACGPGAVAATVAAMREVSAVRYVELRHTCSAEVELPDDRDPYNSVGYEAGVFLQPS
jgi:AmmeMemoRadiSam system protein B